MLLENTCLFLSYMFYKYEMNESLIISISTYILQTECFVIMMKYKICYSHLIISAQSHFKFNSNIALKN